MIRRITFAGMAVFMCFLAQGANRVQSQPEFAPDKFIIKGQLISASFFRDRAWTPAKSPITDESVMISLQFLVEDAVAEVKGVEVGDIVTVATNIKFDLSKLTSENYRELVENAIGNGARLGESFLVLTRWPGAKGRELLSFQPATPETEKELREQHRDYIMRFRRYNNKNNFTALHMRLRSETDLIDKSLADIASAGPNDPKYVQALTNTLRHYVDECRKDIEYINQQLNSKQEEINRLLHAAKEEDERRALEDMMRDLSGIGQKIEAQRTVILDHLRKAGFEHMLAIEPGSQPTSQEE